MAPAIQLGSAVTSRPLDDQFEFVLYAVNRLLTRNMNQQIRRLGVSQSQMNVLLHLSQARRMNQTEIAQELGIGKAAAGALIADLESRNLLRRSTDPSDRRSSIVELTGAGVRKTAEFDEYARDFGVLLRHGINRDDLRRFHSVLAQMRRNLEDVDERSPQDAGPHRDSAKPPRS